MKDDSGGVLSGRFFQNRACGSLHSDSNVVYFGNVKNGARFHVRLIEEEDYLILLGIIYRPRTIDTRHR